MSEHATAGTEGPLAGHLVIDLTRALAGPHVGMLLGDLGARVIKVESPESGDDSRGWGPPFVGPAGARESTYFLSANRNKESITVDLKSDEGRSLLTRLVQRADVLLENFRPGVLDRLGFSIARLQELNPALVVLSITGFGHDGPEANRPGYDQIAQGEGGVMSITGEPGSPTKIGIPIADLFAAMYGATGVLAALVERQRTGRGRVVRTSLLAALTGVHAFYGTWWTVAGEVPQATGNHHPSLAPYGLFQTATSPIQLSVGSQRQWRDFAPLVGLDPLDPRFATNADRVGNRGQLLAEIEEAFARARAEDWIARLDAAGIPAGRVRTIDEVYRWEQTLSQGLLIEVDHATLGRIALPGPAVRFEGGGREQHDAPPTLGQHDQSIRAWLDEDQNPRQDEGGGQPTPAGS
jgi:crotonobetainyl-CoA:carnitine CoA-transferase CaiB-like acyl-CoA transferase